MPKVQKFSSVLMLTFFLVKNLFMFSVRISSYGARGKFEGHEKCVRVARGAAESNSSFLSALQASPRAFITRYTHS